MICNELTVQQLLWSVKEEV